MKTGRTFSEQEGDDVIATKTRTSSVADLFLDRSHKMSTFVFDAASFAVARELSRRSQGELVANQTVISRLDGCPCNIEFALLVLLYLDSWRPPPVPFLALRWLGLLALTPALEKDVLLE